MMTPLPASPEESFWLWFLTHEKELLNWEQDRERIFDLLHDELKKVDEDLTFEFGPPESQREFILSANGVRESFPAVLRLQSTSPTLTNWKLIAFRPRRWPPGVICMDEVEVRSQDMSFTLLTRETTIGLRLFMPGYSEAGPMKSIAYLFLDEALGEFDVETKLALIKLLPTDDPVEGDRYPFIELPKRFDDLYTAINGLSGKPS